MTLALPALSALPACSAAGFLWVAAGGAATAVSLQLGLQAIFDRSSDPVLNKKPGVVTHSVIACMFCIFVTAIGCVGWFNPPAALVATASTRLLTPVDSVRWLAAFGFGVIGVWDIPTCFAVPDLRKPSFLIHHFAMAAVAGCGLVLPSYYAFFFLGVIEASSIPLSIYEGLERAYDVASEADECAPERCERLKSLRDNTQTIATFAFMFMRLYVFTRVTFFGLWPDARAVLPTMLPSAAKNTVKFLMGASASFVGLQFFWFGQIIQQIFIAKWFAPKGGAEAA